MRCGSRWALLAVGLSLVGCSKEEGGAKAQPSASAPAASSPAASPSAPVPSATASATAPPVECPKGSSGEGSFSKPCEGSGATRMMEVAWTGKTDDKGPYFRVTNKSPSVILYGRLAVYFYDKAGKQIEIKDATANPPKTSPYHTCGGNMFGGVMKAGEKAVLTFSCVKKEDVPEGAAAIEAEMQWIGVADASEKKVTAYWRNEGLTPAVRRKGGVK